MSRTRLLKLTQTLLTPNFDRTMAVRRLSLLQTNRAVPFGGNGLSSPVHSELKRSTQQTRQILRESLQYAGKYSNQVSRTIGGERLTVNYPPMDTDARTEAMHTLRRLIRTERRSLRLKPSPRSKTRGVRHAPGHFIKALKKKQFACLGQAKRPQDDAEYVGIELEFVSNVNRDAVKELLFDAGVANYIHVKSDSSINCDNSDADDTYCEDCEDHGCGCIEGNEREHGLELAMLCPVEKRAEIIRKTCAALTGVASVNRSCGLHVHVDFRKYRNDHANRDRIYNNFIACQGLLFKMQPKSRQKNTFCKRSRKRDWNTGRTRYRAINSQSYNVHRTLEIRLHSGTMSADKVNHWCDLLGAIKSYNGTIDAAPRSVPALALLLNLPTQLAAYVKARIELFNPKKESPPAQLEAIEAGEIAEAA